MEQTTGLPAGTSNRLSIELLVKSLSEIFSDHFDANVTFTVRPKPRKEAEES